MPYQQSRDFNPNTAGKKSGWCLQNVRLGFSIGSKHPTAIAGWNADTTKHQDRNIPGGVEVPLWYTFKTEGHVNVRMADGRIWNDGAYFPNLDAYLRSKPSVKYLGWTETVNGTRVIKHQPEVVLASHVQPAQPAQVSIKLNPGHWNVRTAPSLSGSVIGGGKAPALGGQQYAATIDGNGWARISFTGKTGYVGPKSYNRI